MSCLENAKTYEDLLEQFHCLLQDDKDLELEVKLNLLTDMELWMEKEFGDENFDAYDRVFDELWEYDAELLFHSIPTCIRSYIKSLNGKRSRE